MFEEKTIEEIDAIIKEAREAKKRIMNAEKAKADVKTKEILKDVKKGDVLVVVFKGEEVPATFVKLTDKRFVVTIGRRDRTIMFNKLISIS